MDLTVIVSILAVLVLLASLFSPKQGVTTVVLSILIPIGAIVGLAISPNSETLFITLILVSLFVYGGNRYWRNVEGFTR
jgi:hypothetical protein